MKSAARHFLTLEELSSNDLMGLLDLALKVKAKPGRFRKALKGQTLAMIFEKSSTRTRVSFEAGMFQLGGHALCLNGSDLQLGRGETIGDTAKVLSRYAQGIMIRTFAHSTVEGLAREAAVPVINGLTDEHHPCQALADLLTLRERFGKLKGLQLVYVGDGNNVAHSLLIASAKVGMHCRVACPKGYEPSGKVLSRAKMEAKRTGARLEVVDGAKGSVKGADVVYTDVWTSMGQEAEKAKRLQAFRGYQVDEALMRETPKAVFLHCLPAHRGEEVSAGVMDGKSSLVFDQAENRLHSQKALMITLMGS